MQDSSQIGPLRMGLSQEPVYKQMTNFQKWKQREKKYIGSRTHYHTTTIKNQDVFLNKKEKCNILRNKLADRNIQLMWLLARHTVRAHCFSEKFFFKVFNRPFYSKQKTRSFVFCSSTVNKTCTVYTFITSL